MNTPKQLNQALKVSRTLGRVSRGVVTSELIAAPISEVTIGFNAFMCLAAMVELTNQNKLKEREGQGASKDATRGSWPTTRSVRTLRTGHKQRGRTRTALYKGTRAS